MSYAHRWQFMDSLSELVTAGATLPDLHAAMATIEDREHMPSYDAAYVQVLATRWTQHADFALLRLHELFDGIVVDHSDDYVLAMVGHLGGRRAVPIKAFFLRHDEQLREEAFWRIFEVEGGGEISLANIDKFSAAQGNWQETILQLVAEDTLDRPRVLRSCLQALTRDFSSYRAGWFSRTYTALAPTPHEAAVDQDMLRMALGAGVGATVTLAVKHLGAVHKTGLLDADEFVGSCLPALSGSKSAALATLRILAAVSTEPDIVADAASAALAHPHADVQGAAVKLLRSLARDDLIAQGSSNLAPSVASSLGVGAAAAGAEESSTMALPEPSATQRWTDHDALQRFAPLLETAGDAVEFELALAWLAETDSAATILAPLVKRARKRADSTSRYAAALVLAAGGENWSLTNSSAARALPSLIVRIKEVTTILGGSAPRRRLLATPTDDSGRLDARELADRLRDGVARGVDAFPVDLEQALLRVPEPERDSVATEFGLFGGESTESIAVRWESHSWEWEERGRRRSATRWAPRIVVAQRAVPGLIAKVTTPQRKWPGVIATTAASFYPDSLDPLVVGEMAIVDPASTLHLLAAGLPVVNHAVSEATPLGEEQVFAELARHRGRWTQSTAQLVALGLSAKRAELRAVAAELFVDVTDARVSVDDMTAAMTATAQACVLTRWASSLADAASISASATRNVVSVLTGLLPALDRSERGVGALLTVLLDESLRSNSPVVDATLIDWLTGFTGTSNAAKAAKALREFKS